MHMQGREALRIRRNTKPRSGAPRWPAGTADKLALPEGCSAGDLLEVLEFLQACHNSSCGTASLTWTSEPTCLFDL